MYKQQLNDFIAGRLSLEQLKIFIDDRLFELRQTPDINEEQKLLSSLELIIHECDEGLRSCVELFEIIKLIVLPELISTEFVSTVDISPNVGSDTINLVGAAPVTEYPCPEKVLV